LPQPTTGISPGDADLVEDARDAAGDEVAEADDRVDAVAVGEQVVRHAGDDLGLVERASVTS
jgi:hypothetical protein